MQKHRPRQTRSTLWIRLLIAIVVSLLCSVGALLFILSTGHILDSYWYYILPIIFTAIGLIIPLLQWLFPISPENKEASGHADSSSLQPSSNNISVYQSGSSLDANRESIHNSQSHDFPLWSIPYRRNPFFTSREAVLTNLHEQFNKKKTSALTQAQAIYGLGGIGKTQIAIEYAYRYRSEYQAVFWINATTETTLISDFMTVAGLLHLQGTDPDENNQEKIVKSVQYWLTQHDNWLLILDNADDLPMVTEFLPPSNTGHILLTTRDQAIGGIADSIEVKTMGRKEGTLFLLRRAKVIALDDAVVNASQEDCALAESIVTMLEGLPLSLDQAGAYLEEMRCGLQRYQELYQAQRLKLLSRRGRLPSDHPESVTTTFSLCFQQIQRASTVAADILRLCAFVHPDPLPESILMQEAPKLGRVLKVLSNDPFKLDEAIGELLRYSLIRRSEEN